MSLTDKQIRFCEEYIVDFNATQAAIRSGYAKGSARQIASENLSKPNIQSYITELHKKLSERNDNLADRVVSELEKIGFCNIQDYIEEGNTVIDLTTIERPTAAAVSSIKKTVVEYGSEEMTTVKTTTEFKLHDKISALEKLGRYAGIFEKDNQQSRPEVAPMNDAQVDKIIETLRSRN